MHSYKIALVFLLHRVCVLTSYIISEEKLKVNLQHSRRSELQGRLLNIVSTKINTPPHLIYLHITILYMYMGYSVESLFFCLQEWHDEFLQWNPDDYGGMKTLVVDPTKLWVPKLAIGNR